MVKIREWRKEIWEHKYLLLLSLSFLIIAILLDWAAGVYVMKTPGAVAPDLFLDYLPVMDLDFIFIYGPIIIVGLLFLYPLFFKVKELHKVIGQFSLLVMVRSAFTTLTHLEVPKDALQFTIPHFLGFLSFRNDLFFSGHTAVPFLGFLLFKESKIKWFFLAASILMALTVLLMHVHYTIDVLSAFFITYGTFKIGEWFYKKINNY